MTEFGLIKKFFAEVGAVRSDVELSIGDDCALIRPPAEQLLAITTDTLVAGVHFLPDVSAFDLGYKSVAVNLSDLAAMGAEPAWITLALTLANINEAWLAEFSRGMATLLKPYNLQLIGGDTTQGPLTITIQAHGFVPSSSVLKRANAQPGDKIYVTGTLGDAGAGLRIIKQMLKLPEAIMEPLLLRLHRPTPRVKEGIALRQVASSAIDISDGLIADLTHILTSSRVGAHLDVETLPISPTLNQAVDRATALQLALTAGDDYELCFTVPPSHETKLSRLPVECTCIGYIEREPGLRLYSNSGKSYPLPGKLGYQHFTN